MKRDYSLYLVTDRSLMTANTLSEAVTQAIVGGCTMVQLREKNSSSHDFFKLATEIKAVTDSFGVPLIINDRIDIALAVRADGVHIGQSDIPAAAAREIIGGDMLMGVSVSSVSEAIQAQKEGADYIGVGAMFPTDTKTDAAAVSMGELWNIRLSVDLPIVAIGGISKENAGLFRNMGINGLAVVSAVIAQPDIRLAAAELKRLFVGDAI
jgi:thiamine-phosphate pyrophosphorylase